MSVPVALADLAARIDEFGPRPLLVTVGADAAPHVVSVTVGWRDDVLTAGAGRRTAGNVATNAVVTLVWPPAGDGPYALIVDGTARVTGAGDDLALDIAPTAAVLHRVAGAPADLPSCVKVIATA